MENLHGLPPKLRDAIKLRDKAMSGDLVLIVTPATTGSSAAAVNAAIGGAAAKFTRNVVVQLKTAAGELATWFNGTFAIAGSQTSVGGTAETSAATVTLVDGRGTCTLEYTGAWLAGETATVTVTGGTKLGYAVTDKTSVDTLIE